MKAQKTFRFCLITAVLTFVFIGCAPNRAETVFTAEVMDINGDILTVHPAEGSAELKSADQITLQNVSKETFRKGDRIEIAYDADILETYPAQLGEVYAINLAHPG